MPVVSQHLLSATRLARQRLRAEQARQRSGKRHLVHYFHQVDDPYCALTAGVLSQMLARYDLDIAAHVVGAPADAAAPEREKLIAYSRRDAQRLAQHFGLGFRDPGAQPSPAAVRQANAQLVHAVATGRFMEQVVEVTQGLWQGASQVASHWAAYDASVPEDVSVKAHLNAAQQLRQALGHYLGATFFYAGEWYWGIDRLYHLERRLQALGAQRPMVQGCLFAPPGDLQHDVTLDAPEPIEFFFSLRSPYSAIVAPRVFELGRHTGAAVHLRFVLPMVMRGLPVPGIKRRYIASDTAREARARSIAFGCINDPVGRPTERGLALIPFAQSRGQGQAYVLSFMRGVWAQGLDAGSDKGLRTIVERADLPWQQARDALQDQRWRMTAEANRQEMFGLGLWGVPSFRVGDTAVWGQDRLWVVQETLLKRQKVSAVAP